MSAAANHRQLASTAAAAIRLSTCSSSRSSFEDDSVSDIREALDHIFTALPTPPASSVASSSTDCSAPRSLRSRPHVTIDTTRSSPPTSDSEPGKHITRTPTAAARVRGPAPTHPPRCPLPQPPSTATHSASPSQDDAYTRATLHPHVRIPHTLRSKPPSPPRLHHLPSKRSLSPIEASHDSATQQRDEDDEMQPRLDSKSAKLGGARREASSTSEDSDLVPAQADRESVAATADKRPSVSSFMTDVTDSVEGGSSVTEKRVWRISSSGQHYLDDAFTAAFGSPSLEQLAGSFGNAPTPSASAAASPQSEVLLEGAGVSGDRHCGATLHTPSPSGSRPVTGSSAHLSPFQHRGPLLLSELSSPGSATSPSHEVSMQTQQQQQRRKAMNASGLPYVSNPVLQPYSQSGHAVIRSNSNTQPATTREQKLALLRLRQQELLLEQQRLEAQEMEVEDIDMDERSSPEEQEQQLRHVHEADAAAAEAAAAAAASAKELQQLERRRLEQEQKRKTERKMRIAPILSSPPPPLPPSAIKAGLSPSSTAFSSPAPQSASMMEMASEYEMASLRAQVTQLQLALKKQMGAGGPAGAKHGRSAASNANQSRMDQLAAEFMGLSTPEESFSGSTVSGNGGGGGGNGYPLSPTSFHGGASTSVAGSRFEYDRVPSQPSVRRAPSSAFRHGTGDAMHDRRFATGSTVSSSRSAMGGASGGLNASFMASQETFGRPYGVGGSHTVHGSEVTSRMDDSASAMVRPGDDRVEELSAKLERLEEMFRLTALHQQQQHDLTPSNSSQSGGPGGEGTGMSRQLSVRQSDSGSPTTLMAHQQLEQQFHYATHDGFGPGTDDQRMGQHGPMRRPPSVNSLSNYSQGYGSVRTRSPAASAFNFNATPYQRFSPEHPHVQQAQSQTLIHPGQRHGMSGADMQQHHHHQQQHQPPPPHQSQQQQHHHQQHLSSSGAKSITSSTSSLQAMTSNGGASESTKVENVRRKGVARFILGSSTTKLVDAHGGIVPSMQVSMSRNRTDRVEKPTKVKVKSAGRGRVVVVQKDK